MKHTMKHDELLRGFLRKKYPRFIELFEQLPRELVQLINENDEVFDEMANNRFDLGMLKMACIPKEETTS